MNTATILRLLTNAGFHNVSVDANFVYVEDPACVLRSFEVFVEYVWVAIAIATGFMLTGWAISIIRGAKTDNLFVNFRNIILLFAILTAVRPIMNVVYGGDFFALGCKTLSMPIDKVNELLELREDQLSSLNEDGIYENIEIYDYEKINEPRNDAQEEYNTPQDAEQPQTPTQTEEILPVMATESGKNVIYHMPQGNKIKHIDGSRSWRNNNPGNIRYSNFTKKAGAIGKAGGFSVFPHKDIGMKTIEALLQTDSYYTKSIKEAISRYAPPSENDTAAYYNRLSKLTGLPIDKKISDLTPEEMHKVAQAIQTIEGWKVGEIERME